MTTANPTYRVQRALTEPELRVIIAGIEQASTSTELLGAALRNILNPLLADIGLSLDDFDADHRLRPTDYAIPTSQWDALTEAITNRATDWGGSIQVGLELINLGPGTYDDPLAPAPPIAITDRRPAEHLLHLTRDAVDTIGACTRHLADLGSFYGPHSDIYHEALASWHRCLTGVFGMSFGGETHITVDGNLSLLVTCASGFVYAIIFHGHQRHCTVTGCGAAIHDDGTTDQPPAPDGHEHRPDYPLDGPQPGTWSLHS